MVFAKSNMVETGPASCICGCRACQLDLDFELRRLGQGLNNDKQNHGSFIAIWKQLRAPPNILLLLDYSYGHSLDDYIFVGIPMTPMVTHGHPWSPMVSGSSYHPVFCPAMAFHSSPFLHAATLESPSVPVHFNFATESLVKHIHVAGQ